MLSGWDTKFNVHPRDDALIDESCKAPGWQLLAGLRFGLRLDSSEASAHTSRLSLLVSNNLMTVMIITMMKIMTSHHDNNRYR